MYIVWVLQSTHEDIQYCEGFWELVIHNNFTIYANSGIVEPYV
jgi:hypothetical protein